MAGILARFLRGRIHFLEKALTNTLLTFASRHIAAIHMVEISDIRITVNGHMQEPTFYCGTGVQPDGLIPGWHDSSALEGLTVSGV